MKNTPARRIDLKHLKLGDGRGKHRRVRMADESQQEQRVRKERRMIRHVPVMLKVLEIILAVLAIGLIVDPLNSFQKVWNRTHFKLDDAAIIYVTIAGYIIINTLFIICHVLGDQIPKRTLTVFASVGALLHVVAGSVIVYNWKKIHGPHYNNELYASKQYMDMFISGGVFTFVNAAVFILEVVFMVRISSKGTE